MLYTCFKVFIYSYKYIKVISILNLIQLKKNLLNSKSNFVNNLEELKQLIPLSGRKIRPSGAVWVSWKKEPLTINDVNEHTVKHVAEQHGLSCENLCELNSEWWGIKLVPTT